jgi:hypothetical protein
LYSGRFEDVFSNGRIITTSLAAAVCAATFEESKMTGRMKSRAASAAHIKTCRLSMNCIKLSPQTGKFATQKRARTNSGAALKSDAASSTPVGLEEQKN